MFISYTTFQQGIYLTDSFDALCFSSLLCILVYNNFEQFICWPRIMRMIDNKLNRIKENFHVFFSSDGKLEPITKKSENLMLINSSSIQPKSCCIQSFNESHLFPHQNNQGKRKHRPFPQTSHPLTCTDRMKSQRMRMVSLRRNTC